MTTPSFYGRWRGYADIVAAFLGNGATAGSNKLGAALADLTSNDGYVSASYETAVVNMQAAAPNYTDFVMPARSGKLFYLMALQFRVVTSNHAGASVALQFELAQNGATITPAGANLQLSAVQLNLFTAPFIAASGGTPGSVDTSAHPLQVKVIQVPGGTFAGTGQWVATGYWK